jgi:hypothetical protein
MIKEQSNTSMTMLKKSKHNENIIDKRFFLNIEMKRIKQPLFFCWKVNTHTWLTMLLTRKKIKNQ